MTCDVCQGSGETITTINYDSNWHGKKQEKLEQKCYKCKGSGQINSNGLQEPSFDEHLGGRARDLDDGIEK